MVESFLKELLPPKTIKVTRNNFIFQQELKRRSKDLSHSLETLILMFCKKTKAGIKSPLPRTFSNKNHKVWISLMTHMKVFLRALILRASLPPFFPKRRHLLVRI